jgi:lysine 6-dehydrogenase
VRGSKEGRQTSRIYELVAASNRELDLLSSAYWTSVPLTIAVAMLGEGRITKPGVFPPETAVDPALFLEQLKNRGLDVCERGDRRG